MYAGWMIILFALAGTLLAGGDADGDGLDDAWEQQMLERFAPRLMLSVGECDVMPARFAPDEAEPRPLERDGTLYGQVLPWTGGEEGAWVEIHYYHLWANDCGRLAHPLDVERVSVLLRGPTKEAPVEEWRAVYWFAAAHENTVCDVSHGAKAEWLKAEMGGATVYVSRGKHASFLTRQRCGNGCGGDICQPVDNALTPPRIINVGAPGAPLNGAVWTASKKWPMREKMGTDFGPAVISRLDSKKKAASVNDGLIPLQSLVMGGEHTLRGLGTAGNHTDSSLQKAEKATGNALQKSAKAVGRFLGIGKK